VVLPVFKLIAHVSTDVNQVQIATGIQNIEKWKAKAQAIKDKQATDNEEQQQ